MRAGSRSPAEPTRLRSSLPLLVTGIGTDDEHDATAANDLALVAHATNAGANLHDDDGDRFRPPLQTVSGRIEPSHR
jgi:hypothetical protein